MPSRAELFFEEIFSSGDPFAFLSDVPNREQLLGESEWLEFKRSSGDNREALKTWSEAVSGFANTEGGVLIWGLDCRPKGKVDGVGEVKLIDDPAALRSLLRTNINHTADPPVQGIEVREVVQPDGRGFVVCLIPESSNKPHRAVHTTNGPYMIRAGDSFVIANHSLLRSLFYPRASPDIALRLLVNWDRMSWPSNTSQQPYFTYIAEFHNLGPATAHDLFISVQASADGPFDTVSYGWTKADSGFQSANFASDRALHPGLKTKCFQWQAKLKYMGHGWGHLEPREGFDLQVVAYARDMDPQFLYVSLSSDEAEDRVEKWAQRGWPTPPKRIYPDGLKRI